MEMEQLESNNIHESKKKKGGDDRADKEDRDFKEFLDDIEEDPEMRQNIMLFKVNLFLKLIYLFRMRK